MARQLWQALMDQTGGVDVWRFSHPATKGISFYPHVHPTHSCVHYFLVRQSSPTFSEVMQYILSNNYYRSRPTSAGFSTFQTKITPKLATKHRFILL